MWEQYVSDKKNEVETWATWAAIYTPYPSEIKRAGFDNMMSDIADCLYDPENELAKKWGDFGISGQLDRFIEIDVFEGENTQDRTMNEFQDDLAAFLGSRGYQGDITIARRACMTDKIELVEDEA